MKIIKDYKTCQELIKSKTLVFVGTISDAVYNGFNRIQQYTETYYKDESGQLYKYRHYIKPLTLQCNRNSLNSFVYAYGKNLISLFESVRDGLDFKTIDLNVTKTHHHQDKIYLRLNNQIKNKEILKQNYNTIISEKIRESLNEFIQDNDYPAENLIENLLAIPQMQDNPQNEILKIELLQKLSDIKNNNNLENEL